MDRRHSSCVYDGVAGGCCTTCTLPADPTIALEYTDNGEITLTFQQANMVAADQCMTLCSPPQGVPPSYETYQHECSCDYISAGASSPGTVTYELYQLFPTSVCPGAAGMHR